MDGGAWWAVVHGVTQLDMTEQFHFTSLLQPRFDQISGHYSLVILTDKF